MRTLHRLIACAAFAAAMLTQPLYAQPANQIPLIDGPTYVMTYVEVVPSATDRAIAMLRQYRDASRREQGANQIDLYQEDGQSHRFVVSEIWESRSRVTAHADSAATAALQDSLKPIALGPVDVRIHQAHAVTPPRAPNGNDIIIISHVDVAGGNTQNLIALLGPLGEESRRENGVVRYEILDEVPAHPNHFRLFEEWGSSSAWEAHNLAPHTQHFRQAVLPMLGTPYDQRLYKLLD